MPNMKGGLDHDKADKHACVWDLTSEQKSLKSIGHQYSIYSDLGSKALINSL